MTRSVKMVCFLLFLVGNWINYSDQLFEVVKGTKSMLWNNTVGIFPFD